MEVSGSSDIPKAVSPADGPVAVTGASGYIGSWTVRDLLEKGYRPACAIWGKPIRWIIYWQ